MGEESAVGFSPCAGYRPVNGKRDLEKLAGAKALII
jgi:hypothetical protein